MIFKMPTIIYEEKECVKNHGKDMKKYGDKALIVTGRSSSKINGSLEDVTEALKANSISYEIYDRVEENPTVETVMEARDIAVGCDADFVIGIGGGSPMDAAKAIAVMAYYKEKGAEFLYESVTDVKSLPVIAVPTTCGTGSEATGTAVLTLHSAKTKKSMNHKIFPKLSLVDCKYIKNAPTKIINDTAIDALAHLVESYINSNATDYSRMLACEGLRIWSKSRKAFESGSAADEDYRNMMNASTIAGMAIAHTGTSLPHGLSYTLTYNMGMPHGKAVGYFLGGYLSEAPEEYSIPVLKLAGFKNADEYKEFYKKVCNPEKVSEEMLDKAVEAVISNESKLKNCPFKVDKEAVLRMTELYA